MYLGEERIEEIDILQATIQYRFSDINLLTQALTHSSYINENGSGLKDYERFEFLGDAVIDLVVSDYSLKEFDDFSEGDLSKLRSRLVSEANLAYLARTIDLGRFLLLGRGEELTDGRNKDSILACSLEALFGAIFLDSGYHEASEAFLKIIKKADVESKFFDDQDYKSKLQELLQGKQGKIPTYRVLKEEGPGHSKIFEIGVYVNKKILEKGTGKNKKEAEQKAAKRALKRIAKEDFDF